MDIVLWDSTRVRHSRAKFPFCRQLKQELIDARTASAATAMGAGTVVDAGGDGYTPCGTTISFGGTGIKGSVRDASEE